MKKSMMVSLGVFLVLAGSASAAVEVNIYGAGAPNVYGGGGVSYDAWWANARSAIRDGLTNLGSGVIEYIQLSNTNGTSAQQEAYQALVTGFDSWHGVAGGTGEYGTRIHFIYHIKATEGEALALANITNIQTFENGWGDTDYDLFGPASFNSSTAFEARKRVGYLADGTPVTSGTDMTGVTEIIGTFGMAYAVYYGAGQYWYQDGDTQQDTLNRAMADIDANLQSWRGTLTYSGTTVDTTVTFIPEPASLCLLAVGGLAMLRRRHA